MVRNSKYFMFQRMGFGMFIKSPALINFLIFLFILMRGNSAYSIVVTPSSQYAVANQDFILTCTTIDVPIAVLWKRNGTDAFYMLLNSNTCSISDVVPGLSSNYRYNCTDNKTYNLIIPGDRIQQEDGSYWQCLDAGSSIGNNSSVFTVRMARPPTSDPVVTGYSGTILYPGNTLKLTCTVQDGTPLATLSWTCKGSSVTGTDKSTTTTGISDVTVNIDSSYNGRKCVCKAEHLTWTTDKTAENQQLVVYFAPDTAPVISGYTNNQIIYEPENKDLTCRVTGGNPVATLTWSCRGLAVSGTNQSVEGEARSTISLDIKRDYDNKQCTCRATHPADNYNRQTYVMFTVYYPPSSPVVTNNFTSFPLLEGGRGSLFCLSSPGNPPSSFQWKANEVLVTEEKRQMIHFTGLTKEFNMRNYSCEVYNNYTRHKDQHLWSPNIPLNVEYSPVISVGTTPTYITEGKDFTRSCTAQGNPVPSIKWISGNQHSEVLQFINSKRNQTGNYTCEAIGRSVIYGDLKSQKDLTVIVQYPPIVTVLLSNLINGQTSNIVCTAKGVPDYYYYTSWTQMYGDVVIRKGLNFGSLSSDNSRLTLTDVSYQDIGIYKCTAHNTIKDRNGVLEQQGSAYLNISFPPAFMQKSQRKMYAELGHKVDIEIPFFSNPAIGPPDQPYKLLILSNTTTSITVGWTSDFNGGYPQTFVIVYTPVNNKGKPKELRVKEVEHKRNYNYTLINLNPGTEYLIWIYSFNRKGNSTQDFDSIMRVTSKTKPKQIDGQLKNENIGIIIGVLGGFVFGVISVLTVMFVIIRLRKGTSEGEGVPVRNEAFYEDLNEERSREINTYDRIEMEANSNTQEAKICNQYESLNRNLENTTATYQQLKSKDQNSIPMDLIYVNTTLKNH